MGKWQGKDVETLKKEFLESSPQYEEVKHDRRLLGYLETVSEKRAEILCNGAPSNDDQKTELKQNIIDMMKAYFKLQRVLDPTRVALLEDVDMLDNTKKILNQISSFSLNGLENACSSHEKTDNLFSCFFKSSSEEIKELFSDNIMIEVNDDLIEKDDLTQSVAEEKLDEDSIQEIDSDKQDYEIWYASLEETLRAHGINPADPHALARIKVDKCLTYPDDAVSAFDDNENLVQYASRLEKRYNYSHYAFMNVDKNGNYTHPRPENGQSITWMEKNMLNYYSAPTSMKKYLFQMAKEERLYLPENNKGSEARIDGNFIRVTDHNTAYITKSKDKMLAFWNHKLDHPEEQLRPGIDPMSQGYTEETWNRTMELDMNRQQFSRDYGFAQGSLEMYYNDMLVRVKRDQSLSPEQRSTYSKALKLQCRGVILGNREAIEKEVAHTYCAHPEWIQNPEDMKALYDTICAQLVPKTFITDKDLENIQNHPEYHFDALDVEKNLLKISGCNTLTDAMASGKIMKTDGTPFTSMDTKSFMRDVMGEIKNNGLAILNTDGEAFTYKFNGDYGLCNSCDYSKISKFTTFLHENYFKEIQKAAPTDNYGHVDEDFQKELKTLDKAFKDVFTFDNQVANRKYMLKDTIENPNGPHMLLKKTLATFNEAHKQDNVIGKLATEAVNNYQVLLDDIHQNALGTVKPVTKPTLDIKQYQEEFGRLKKDLFKTNSVFSDDTAAYTDLKKLLEGYNVQKLTDERSMRNALGRVSSQCKEYLDKHSDRTELSSRQMQRLKVMHRLMDLKNMAYSGIVNPSGQLKERLASKITVNSLLEDIKKKQAKGQDVSDYIRLVTHRDNFVLAVDKVAKDPNFKSFVTGNEVILGKMLRTNGNKLHTVFMNHQKKAEINCKADPTVYKEVKPTIKGKNKETENVKSNLSVTAHN